MQGPETRLRKKIQKALGEKFPGALFLKIHGGPMQNVGVPDLLCCVNGIFVGLEIKTEKGVVSLAQEIMLGRIKKAKGVSAVVRSVEEAVTVVSGIADAL